MRSIGSAQELEHRRRTAVALVEEDVPVQEVADRFDVTPRSVQRWRKAAREEGPQGIAAKPHPGPEPWLSPDQRERLGTILGQGAMAQGFETDLWTCSRVAAVIEREFDVSYHPGHVSRILHDIGFSRQKPETRAREHDAAAAHEWREAAWHAVKKGPRRKS